MKRIGFLLLLLPIWAGCNWADDPYYGNKEFVHTGCAGSPFTRGINGSEGESLLTIKYEDGGLRVTRTNAVMNCSIKNGGITCSATVDGNVIHYWATETDGPSANCMCLVEEMSSVVTGLQTGKEYTLDYRCEIQYPSITFVFKK